MSAVSVVPPMQATQRPMTGSSSVSSCTSTGPLVVAIRTRNLPAARDMARRLNYERAGGHGIGEQAQKTCIGFVLLVQDHHHFAVLIGAGQSALDEIAFGAFQQYRARRLGR